VASACTAPATRAAGAPFSTPRAPWHERLHGQPAGRRAGEERVERGARRRVERAGEPRVAGRQGQARRRPRRRLRIQRYRRRDAEDDGARQAGHGPAPTPRGARPHGSPTTITE
jgi:hypothetical protein